MINFKSIFVAATFVLSSFCVMAQEKVAVLSGKVLDADDGYPLVGVAVMAHGTKYGIVTEDDGTFELRIPDQPCEVVFSYIGYDEVLIYYTGKNKSSFSRVIMTVNATL